MVNTASKCGFTPQFKPASRSCTREYQDQGLEVLGFPCNQFGKQDPGSNGEITGVLPAELRRVSFPMFGKVEVNGGGAEPLYQHLKQRSTGCPGQRGYQVELHQVPDGYLMVTSCERYAPKDQAGRDIAADIEALLASSGRGWCEPAPAAT